MRRLAPWMAASLGALVVAAPRPISPGLASIGSLDPVHTSASRAGLLTASAPGSFTVPAAAPSAPSRSLAPIGPARFEKIIDALRERLEAAPQSSGPAVLLDPGSRRDRSSSRGLVLLEAAGLIRRTDASVDVAGIEHSRYRLFKQGRPVLNRVGILHEREGELIGRAGQVAFPPLSLEPAAFGKGEALERALRAVGVEATRGSPLVEQGWFALPRVTAPAWRIVIPAMRPFGTWQVILDARTGQTLSLVDLVRTATGVGSVYDPNRALSPTPTDVPLFRLDDSGQLQGDIVRVFDAQAPAAFRSDLAFRFPESDPRFAQTSVYRGVTDTGIFAEGRGFPAFTESLIAYTNLPGSAPGTEFNNAFYDPFFHLLGFGNGDGSVTANLGTDLDVAAHETGHHLFEVLVQPLTLSALDPVEAMDEGVADTIAALVGGDPNVGESTIPGQPFLRTLVNSARFPDDFAQDPHVTGLIYGGTNWDLIQLLGADTFTELLFAALAALPSDALETDYRDAFLDANLALRGGLDQSQIQGIFTARGFDDVELPPEFEGYLEDGIPQARFLPDSPFDPDPMNWNFHVFVFSEFPSSTSLTVQTTGTGDVDLVIVSLDDLGASVAVAESPGSYEVITLTGSTDPSIDVGDNWMIVVVDYPDGSSSSYSVTADATLPPAAIVIDGSAFKGKIDVAGGFDAITFDSSFPNQVVRLEADALDPTLDPLVGILDPETFEVLGVDDDSGLGTNAIIQGALLPSPGTYAIVILSVTGDVDPTTGTGGYQLWLENCDNTIGPNTDGDALVDACDDDDDDDGIIDSVDSDPLDPDLCADLDLDGCDDCSSGVLDVFQDGPDNDADALCDAGDPDDDNDGCTDDVDVAPLLASPDDDFDFLGSDCDNCTTVPNADQADLDAGLDDDSSQAGIQHYGDACDADLDNDGIVGATDFFGLFRPCLGQSPSSAPECAVCDFDGDDMVGATDFFGYLRPAMGEVPGPGYTEP